ncbi:MAG TPA: hypothetical protein VFH43_09840 [Candidatus Kapabacteria bacterium]|nr:hypothetical protein [Candidatus Kapabacteria bacterium]
MVPGSEASPTILILVLCVLLVLYPAKTAAQDLENIAEEKPIGLTGALTASLVSYNASGIEDRHTPFSWMIEGSPTLSLYGVMIPFNFIISEQQRDFRQPFNQFGLSPTYKRFTAHLGYRNMNFSRYTLAGHTFLGGGFDFKPGIFRFAGMYGRLQRPIEQDTSRFDIDPAYERYGYGVKAGIGGDRDFVDLNMFYAEDDSNSLAHIPFASDILPSENLVLGLNSRIGIIEELTLEAEAASSVFTRDVRAPKMTSTKIPEGIHGIFRITEATSFTFATQAAIAFRIPTFQARLQWERVEPDYKSLGTYYLLTDLERWTFAPTLLLIENKLRLSTSIGLEHDNLLNTRVRTTNRLIGSGAISYNPSQRFGIDANYSNYSTDQKRAVTIADLRDTLPDGSLRLTNNVAQSISLAPRLMFQEETLNQLLALVIAYQEYQDRTAGIGDLTDSKALTSSINYNRAYLQQGSTLGGSIIFSRAQAGIAKTTMFGGSINGSMSFLEEKALTASASLGATTSSISTLASSTFSLNQTINGNYKITDRNILTLSLYASQNSGYDLPDGSSTDGYSEMTATLSFSHLLDF